MSLSPVRLAFLSLALLPLSYLSAQISQATLSGVVKDSTGAVVPGAKVELKNKATGLTRAVTTDASGEYTIPNLTPDDYSLNISMTGFKTIAVESLPLHTGDEATYNATLEVGAASQEITVGAAVPLVNTTTAEVSHLVPPSQVAELPLNGRNFWELTQLTPGATFIPRGQTAQYNGSEIRARAVNVTVNGQSYIFTGWSLDGANITNFELGGTLIQPNVDAIQEFSVQAGNMSPEYGHSPNMINASLKSGSNSFHGTLFEYLRNDAFDARNFFLPQKIPLKRNQYGFTLGGPIWKDKIFFFTDLQNTTLRQGTTFNNVVPSVAERNGNFSVLTKQLIDPTTRQAFPGNIIPASKISPQGAYFASLFPTPNLLQGTTSRAVYSTGTPIDQNQADFRLDANPRTNDLFMARYSIADNRELNPNPYPALGSTNLHSQAENMTLRYTHIYTPRLLNVAQVSYYKSPFLFGPVLPGFDLLQQAGVQGFEDPVVVPVKSFPNINLSGYQAFQGSPSDQRPKSINIHTWQLSDSVTYNLGRHELKFGMEWLYRHDAFSISQNSNGNFSFVGTYSGDAVADMLLGYPDNVTRSAFQTLQGSWDNFKSWYFNDNFRVLPNLTLNLGLRYEVDPFFQGIRQTRTGFDLQTGKVVVPNNIPANAQPLYPQLAQLFSDRIVSAGSLGLPNSISPSDKTAFAPRVGFAWSPDGSQKLAVRSGYGIFYTFPDTNLINNTVVTVPFVDNVTVFNDRPPAVPTRTFANFFEGAPLASPNPNPGQPCAFGYAAPSCDTPGITSSLIHLKQQYTQQWNLSIERQLGSRTSIAVAYVGNKTSHLQQGIRENDPPPGPGAIQNRRIYPQWGPISLQEWGGKGSYNALQTSINFRDWHGLTLMGSYVWSKCLDNGTDEAGPVATQLNGANYAPCDFDQRHTSSISFNYALPFGPGKTFLDSNSRWIKYAVGGWNLSAVTTLKSGLPFTPTINGDIANTGVTSQRPNVVGQPIVLGDVACWFYVAANPGCRAADPTGTASFADPAQYTYGNSGRNILRADNLLQLDLALLKDFPFTETKRLEFRAESFNLTNHPVFNAPTTTIDIASGGQISSTLNSNRILEFALKLYF
jgi:Carboxypeptidase regulatory-like domain